ERAREHRDARLAPLRREGERVFLPRGVLVVEARLHLAPRQPLPAAVADLLEPVTRLDRVGAGALAEPRRDEPRGLARARVRAAVDGVDVVVVQAVAEPLGLPAPVVGEVHTDVAGEAVLRGQ